MSCLDAVNRLAVTNFGMRVVPGWSGLALGRYRKKKEEGRECTTHPFPPLPGVLQGGGRHKRARAFRYCRIRLLRGSGCKGGRHEMAQAFFRLVCQNWL